MVKMGTVLNNFMKIARTASINIKSPEFVNNTIDKGVTHQVYGKLPQIKFFNPELIKQVSANTTIDSSYSNETGRGKIDVAQSKDYYIGEGTY